MSTLNNAELLIITIFIVIFLLVAIVLIIQVLRLVNKIHRITKKAESFVDNAEAAAEAMKRFSKATSRRFPLASLIHSFFEMSKKDK